MPLPRQFHKYIKVFDCWSNPRLLPEYKPEKQFRAVIGFDKVSSKFGNKDGTQGVGDTPKEAKEELINTFNEEKILGESQPIGVIVAGAREVNV